MSVELTVAMKDVTDPGKYMALRQHVADGETPNGLTFSVTTTCGLGGMSLLFEIGEGEQKRIFEIDGRNGLDVALTAYEAGVG